ncbi:magnesium transporter CorA family protein [Ancylobacter sp. 6x-1]|uniref:Magnesium transporter CorA family protein n=1 Tax=Ancylobacter crimeensis TaxID=2579147 RepID=A0ABT0DAV7_9HYPH|nr:magnesium transporter CorA family protein [Ancylobacter crimeensis]MCK0197100.1 magnesium transporter CorA family protein [Ancylobacter crimeensis]
MLEAYCVRGGALRAFTVPPGEAVPGDAVWLDLMAPGEGEEHAVEHACHLAVPTREEMREIEPSSRLYVEDGNRFMTGSVLCQSEASRPTLAAITFILTADRLITVRYGDPKPFRLVAAKLDRACQTGLTGDQVLMELLDAIVDRAADIIERLSNEIDEASDQIFSEQPGADANRRYRALLNLIARKADIASKVRESLVSIARVITFLATDGEGRNLSKDQKGALKTLQRDCTSLNDHLSYLGDKVTFLLDATLGLVSIEQNNIIKIFAVLSVVLMPPTLIASVYGMNFQHMPELQWPFGYPAALLAMLVAAVVPYWFFKWKRWL